VAKSYPDYLVFISHSSRDRWIARQMAAIIERKAQHHGVRVFLDEKDLEAGAIIPEEIRRQLESCEDFLVLLTSQSISRQWVLLELGAAWGLRKRIVAITDKVADDDLPDIIRQTKAYGLNDFDRFVAELVGRAKRRRALCWQLRERLFRSFGSSSAMPQVIVRPPNA
jgi:hypothetical protein